MTPTKAQRQAWGRMGALTLHGTGKTNVKPAHEALRLKWEREADPEGVLAPEVRAKRGAMLRRAFMIEMSLKAAATKRRKRGARPTPAVVLSPAQAQAGFVVIDQKTGTTIATYSTAYAAQRCVEALSDFDPAGSYWYVRRVAGT